MKTWKNVPGKIGVEISVDDDGIWDCYNDIELPMLTPYLTEDDNELIINFLCSGFYEPASMYGGRDNLGHPEDGEEERLFESVYVNQTPLPQNIAQQIFELYQTQIEREEIDYESCC
jgi:hypothetical protein